MAESHNKMLLKRRNSIMFHYYDYLLVFVQALSYFNKNLFLNVEKALKWRMFHAKAGLSMTLWFYASFLFSLVIFCGNTYVICYTCHNELCEE